MEQLSGLDALFLHAEMHGMPMHFSLLSVYDPSSLPDGKIEFRKILELFEKNIELNAPLLNHKLMEVPFNLDQPYWVEDHNFDLVYHVRHIALPMPGNWQKLCSLAANLHAQPINRDRPLWEAYVIDGLDHVVDFPPGCFAILLKVHHAMMNDNAGMSIFNSLHTLFSDKKYGTENFSMAADEGRFMSHEPDISMPRLFARAALNNLYRSGNMVQMMARAVGAYTEISRALKENEIKQLEKPKTRFNGNISPRRVVDRIRFSFVEIDFIRSNIPDSTTNDIALAIISGALRRYLLSKDELPEDSLVAAFPLNEQESDKNFTANNITVANISLRTDIAKPLDRLLRIHKESLAGVAYAKKLGKNVVNETVGNIYTGLLAWGVRTAVETGLLEKFPPANNAIVTNIGGSSEQLFFGGAKLIDSFGMGPLIPNTGLFHAISNTDEYLIISFTADRQKMDDPDFYAQCIQDSFSELIEAIKISL